MEPTERLLQRFALEAVTTFFPGRRLNAEAYKRFIARITRADWEPFTLERAYRCYLSTFATQHWPGLVPSIAA